MKSLTLQNYESYSEQFARVQQNLTEPAWLSARRNEAMQRFEELGFPTRNDEEWRFTNPAQIAETPFVLTDPVKDAEWCADEITSQADLVFGAVAQHARLVFLNGRCLQTGNIAREEHAAVTSLSHLLDEKESSIRDTDVSSCLFSVAIYHSYPFTALNSAFFEDGAVIVIPPGVIIEKPIEIVFVSAQEADDPATFNSPRVLVIAGENSQATVIESYTGQGEGRRLTNAVTEIVVEDGAVIDHYKRVEEHPEAFHIGTMAVRLGRNSNFSSHAFTFAGGLVRNEVYAELPGEHAECTLNGLYVANGDRLIDNHTTIDHIAPNCNSHENYRGILDDQSRGVFNGKIYVRLDAQKTDAKQTNKTLLLSPDARIDTKPQLEILADDVKCTHGATVGQLDSNQVFYLRSRGMTETEARSLLTYAFAGDIVQRVKVESLRSALDQRLLKLLPSR